MSQSHLFPPLPLRDTSRSPLREELVTWGAQRHGGEGPLMVLSQQECTGEGRKRRLEACTDACCLPLSGKELKQLPSHLWICVLI